MYLGRLPFRFPKPLLQEAGSQGEVPELGQGGLEGPHFYQLAV